MNEKIYDAMMKATDTPDFINNKYYWDPKYVERFALLITRICADAADMADEANCRYTGDYVMESLGFSVSDREDPKMISPVLLAMAGEAQFDVKQYDPVKDIDGLPMDFIREYGERIVKKCSAIAENCRRSGGADVSTAILTNFQIED